VTLLRDSISGIRLPVELVLTQYWDAAMAAAKEIARWF
jgi:hypothetical protein